MDYEDAISSHADKTELYRALQACVLCRNGNSAKGINGVSLAFPYKAIEHYTDTSRELKAMSETVEKKTFDEIFSIMAIQQKKDHDKKEKKDDDSLLGLVESMLYVDYTQEPWYVKGFEDYDQSKAYVDIPLKETPEGYEIELPDKAWRTIDDCQTMVYEKVEGESDGIVSRYLGSDYVGADDPQGHPMVTMDENWVHIEGAPVCYKAQPVRQTDDGDVYSGKVRAKLNGKEDITLNIEWDPVQEDSDGPTAGHITNYIADSPWDDMFSDSQLDTKSEKSLQAGDTIQFLFDYYDAEGNLVETKAAGKKIRVTKQSRLTVKDEPLEECDISFGGVLTDVYQRILTTELIDTHIGDGE
jgi:hypothetical protein